MFTEYAEPKTVDEMISRYAEVRKRCYNPPKPREWARQFDLHVKDYRQHMEFRRRQEEQMREIITRFREIRTPQSYRISLNQIIREVAAKHRVSVDAIKGKGRARHIAAARHETAARIYVERPDMSLPNIGKFLGGRDHTTILSSVRKMGVHNVEREPWYVRQARPL